MWGSFLGAFEKLRKVTIRFVMPNVAPCGRIFVKIDMSSFRKSFDKIQVSIKSDKNIGCYFTIECGDCALRHA